MNQELNVAVDGAPMGTFQVPPGMTKQDGVIRLYEIAAALLAKWPTATFTITNWTGITYSCNPKEPK